MNNLSTILKREHVIFQWDDNDVCFDQQRLAGFLVLAVSLNLSFSLKQQSMGRHVAPL
jgi:hypothetical protein